MTTSQPRNVTVKGEHGLHLVPCSLIAKAANSYVSCEITLRTGSKLANAKNIFDLMGLGVGKGTVLELVANGADADAALDALEELFNSGFEPHSRPEIAP